MDFFVFFPFYGLDLGWSVFFFPRSRSLMLIRTLTLSQKGQRNEKGKKRHDYMIFLSIIYDSALFLPPRVHSKGVCTVYVSK